MFCIVGLQLMYCSCKKNNSSEDAVGSIVGKWKLSEVYSDPGDGSGKFTKVNGGKILEFTSEGEVSSNSSLCSMISNGLLHEESSYIISESSGNKNKLIIDKCGYELNYELKGNQLTIYYPCIEGCGERFVRVGN
jgi:hypothetical protein